MLSWCTRTWRLTLIFSVERERVAKMAASRKSPASPDPADERVPVLPLPLPFTLLTLCWYRAEAACH
jgi:hypothetical protein